MSNSTKKKTKRATSTKMCCLCCDKEFNVKDFYASDSDLHRALKKVPYCKGCLDDYYQNYLDKYKGLGYANPDRKAVERICMFLDFYYSDKIFDGALEDSKQERYATATLISLYFRRVNLKQYKDKDYDTTIHDKYKIMKDNDAVMSIVTDHDVEQGEEIKRAIKIFGNGFDNDDYLFLYEQYCDWTARHECETKAQEEIFKQICFTQLELLKATRAKQDTKDLTATFQKLLDAAKLQPKQNSGDATANTQTFGTLIDKWENTRPIPEIDEELKDVDGIGRYIDVYFKGHLAKMLGIKNDHSDLYEREISKYTVEKPEYIEDEDNETLYDAIFGSSAVERGNEEVV